MKKALKLALFAVSTIAITGCASDLGGSSYSEAGVGEVSRTQSGTVVAVRSVKISGKPGGGPGVGAAIGGVSGAVIGSQAFGGGRGRAVTGVLGALAGGTAGHFAEKKLREQQGFEYRVKLDKGGTVSVTQGAEPRLATGQRVSVIYGRRGRARVVPGA